MGRRGRSPQQLDENCGLADETISQTKSCVAFLSAFSLREQSRQLVLNVNLHQGRSSTLDPRSRNNNGLRNSVENQPRLANSLKSLLREQSFLQNRGSRRKLASSRSS